MPDEAGNDSEGLDEGSGDVASESGDLRNMKEDCERVAAEFSGDEGDPVIQRVDMVVEECLQQASEAGESDEAGEHAGAVDAKTLHPFGEVIALGLEDEDL